LSIVPMVFDPRVAPPTCLGRACTEKDSGNFSVARLGALPHAKALDCLGVAARRSVWAELVACASGPGPTLLRESAGASLQGMLESPGGGVLRGLAAAWANRTGGAGETSP